MEMLVLAVVVVLSAHTVLLLRMRRDVQTQWRGLNQLIESLSPPADLGSAVQGEAEQCWSQDSQIRPGAEAPRLLREPGLWVVGVCGAYPDEVVAYLSQDPATPEVATRYIVRGAVEESALGTSAPDPHLVGLPTGTLNGLRLPVAFMVDPEGIVQGVGAIPLNGLAEFVTEGEAHGFGPDQHEAKSGDRQFHMLGNVHTHEH